MLWPMHDLTELYALAFHGERVASRRLAARESLSAEAALRQVLEQAAGARGLAALLAERRTLQLAGQVRSEARAAQRAHTKAERLARHDGPASAWRAWFDGSAHPNPGRCGIGGLLLGPAGERIEISQPAGYGNSSEAEYQALVAVLQAAVHAQARDIAIYGDSQVVIKDAMLGDGEGAPSLALWRGQARAMMAQIATVTLRWVPRHKNPEADRLSQRAVLAWEGQLDDISGPAA